MTKACDLLRREHQSILDALEVLEEFCFLLRAEQDILPEDIQALVDFLARYVHDVHQKKEELFLFPALENSGVSREEGHFAILLAGHEIGSVYLRHLAEASRHSFLNRAGFIESAESYLQMLAAHVEAENATLFPLADERLPEDEQLRLLAEFDRYDRLVIGQEQIDNAEHVLEYFHLKYMENID